MIEISNKKFYLTTAIPYVNAAPHIGHALEFVQTDAIARFQRLLGKDTALTTGADENSLKNVHAAEAKGIIPAQLCKENAAIFKQMAEKIGLSYTSFIRSSVKEEHWFGPQKLWQLCDKAGDIYKKKYRGLYCVGCESFYEEEELPEGVCPEHKKKPDVVEEENYFFKLSKYQKKLEQLIESDKLKVIPETRKNEVLSFIRSGLKDFSISRSVARAKGWGVPVPGDDSQIMYVWVDALSVYITGVGYGKDEKTFKKYWPADVHVIGKGILRFHAIYWPAILLSAGVPVPKCVLVHGYITVEGQKMSKTLGNIVDPFYLIEKYDTDPLRYCLLSEISTFADGDFSERALIEKNNNELLANLGNLVHRTLVFLSNNFDGKIPEGKLNKQDKEFLKNQEKIYKKIAELLEQHRLKEAVDECMAVAHNANRYFQDNKPWELIKKDKTRAASVLYLLANQVKDLAILFEPFLPNSSTAVFEQLAIKPKKWDDLGKLSLPKNHAIGKPKTLFKKLELKKPEAVKIREPKFEVTHSAAKLGIKAAAAILDIEKISNKNAELQKLKEQKFKTDDSGFVELHKAVGAEEGTSIQWLADMASKSGKIPNISTLVDSYNLVSLKTGISAGAHDVSKLKGNVRVDVCNGTEDYTELGTQKSRKIKKGEYSALDSEKVICYLELKQCEQTKVAKNTRKILLYYQGHKGHTQEQVNNALTDACNLIVKFCGGDYKIIYPKNLEKPVSFADLDIELGQIVSVEKHPNADKLYVEKVKLGDKELQIVSGLAQYYKLEELKGKNVLVLRNLAPAKLRGTESQGMLLTCEANDDIELLSSDAKLGTKVHAQGITSKPKKQITIKQFSQVKLEVKNYVAYADGHELLAGKEQIKTQKIKEGKIT